MGGDIKKRVEKLEHQMGFVNGDSIKNINDIPPCVQDAVKLISNLTHQRLINFRIEGEFPAGREGYKQAFLDLAREAKDYPEKLLKHCSSILDDITGRNFIRAYDLYSEWEQAGRPAQWDRVS